MHGDGVHLDRTSRRGIVQIETASVIRRVAFKDHVVESQMAAPALPVQAAALVKSRHLFAVPNGQAAQAHLFRAGEDLKDAIACHCAVAIDDG